MNFDWTTLALEVLNFLVLVWLLKRFFYRPVLAVIEARRAQNEATIAHAEAVSREAAALKDEYQAHLAGVDKDRAAAKARLEEEIAAERSRRMTGLDREIGDMRKRRETLEARERSEREQALERQAMTIAARFVTRLLERLTSPDLEVRLADLALSELAVQAPDRLEALRTALREPGAGVEVASAYPLDAARRTAFTQAMSRLAGRALEPRFSEDTALKAGICIVAGSWVLMANLRDELNFFAGTFDHGG